MSLSRPRNYSTSNEATFRYAKGTFGQRVPLAFAVDAVPATPTNLTAQYPPGKREEGSLIYNQQNNSPYIRTTVGGVPTWTLLTGGGSGGGENLNETLSIGNFSGQVGGGGFGNQSIYMSEFNQAGAFPAVTPSAIGDLIYGSQTGDGAGTRGLILSDPNAYKTFTGNNGGGALPPNLSINAIGARLESGTTTSDGTTVGILAGSATDGAGGDLFLGAGDGVDGDGGRVVINSGTTNNGDAGNIDIVSGTGNNQTGHIVMKTQNAGNITLLQQGGGDGIWFTTTSRINLNALLPSARTEWTAILGQNPLTALTANPHRICSNRNLYNGIFDSQSGGPGTGFEEMVLSVNGNPTQAGAFGEGCSVSCTNSEAVIATGPHTGANSVIEFRTIDTTATSLTNNASSSKIAFAVENGAHIASTGNAPAVASDGVNFTAPIVSIGSTDSKGSVTFTDAANGLGTVTVTFANAYTSAPNVVFSATGQAFTPTGLFVTSNSTSFTITGTGTTGGSNAFNYFVIE